ncbi:MAG: 23S rRNA (adenine(2503)-C(2))-methyltransferase RlmN [Spirochaetota bacterium]|mgnify:FL=1
MPAKRPILSATEDDILAFCREQNAPKYHAKQIQDWIYRKHAISFSEMSDIPKSLRGALEESFYLSRMSVVKTLTSHDGSEKFLFELTDGAHIEAVILRFGTRVTFCLSSQVGCPLHCAFCATGAVYRRNLTVEEIVTQFTVLRGHAKKVNSVVFMGMGEPLLNMKNVMPAIKELTSKDGFNLGTRHVTISTAGIIKGIERLGALESNIRLAVSLNSLRDSVRSKLMPINRKYPLPLLLDTLEAYVEDAKRMLTFEWVLINGVNDSVNEAYRLMRLRRRFAFKVNLIPYNPILTVRHFKTPTPESIERFRSILEGGGIDVMERFRHGQDIGAGCGQLAGSVH